MAFFLIIDLVLNSTLDYDSYNDQYAGNGNSGGVANLLLGLAGLQVVIEITIFLVLFLAMADTFLFRVGLLGLLVKKFRTVLMIHPIYITLTIIAGAFRVKILADGGDLNELWKNPRFMGISISQKIGELTLSLNPFSHPETFFYIRTVSVLYYSLNLRATIKLSDPIYFNKDAWISLVKQVLCLPYTI